MKPKYILTILALATVITVFYSCKDNPVAPIVQPGRRDYTWTEDTIKINEPSLTLSRIWGSSSNNVWATGFGGSVRNEIWHYDGISWKTDSIARDIQPSAIYGFSNYEIWLANGNSTIWKFDGTEWSEYGKYKVEGFDELTIENFYGTSPNNIYGVGAVRNYNNDNYEGVIIHYNGNNWEIVNIPDIIIGFSDIRIEKSTGLLFLEGIGSAQGTFSSKILSWNGHEFKEFHLGSGPALANINDNILIQVDAKIFKYNNGKFILWKDLESPPYIGYLGKIEAARSEKDFLTYSNQGIGQYNGSDFKIIYKTNLNINTACIFEKDVFFVAHNFDTNINIIIHGKLK